jgi:hypothetical protein
MHWNEEAEEEKGCANRAVFTHYYIFVGEIKSLC